MHSEDLTPEGRPVLRVVSPVSPEDKFEGLCERIASKTLSDHLDPVFASLTDEDLGRLITFWARFCRQQGIAHYGLTCDTETPADADDVCRRYRFTVVNVRLAP